MIKGRKVFDETGTKLFLGKYQVVGPRVQAAGTPTAGGAIALPDGTAAGASAAANAIIAVLQTHGLIA
jgi:hypothetical protein